MWTLLFIIPIACCIILFCFFREKTVLWEYAIVLFPSIIVIIITYFGIKSAAYSDIEYLGHYVAKVEYYEDWNEYVHKICTREWTDNEGNTHSETYDCSYVDYHPEQYYMINETNKSIAISKKQYKEILTKLQAKEVFIDLHRHYYTDDGDKYEAYFDNKFEHMFTLTEQHSYKNKILNSYSIFNFSKVSKEEAAENNLYNYSETTYFKDQNPIVGYTCNKNIENLFRIINAYYGGKYQFRTYVMVYKNKPRNIAKLQQDFLVGGNKNELIICIGIDNNDNVQWIESFSWEDKPYISNGINHIISDNNIENININNVLYNIQTYLFNNVPIKWKRKEFSDFDYLTYTLTSNNWILLCAIALVISITLSIIVIFF